MKIESVPAPRRPNGHDRIITFYSYKGGTGRTMAMANVAWILASQGKTVLTIDWDLEAPGLHRYFAPFLADPSLQESTGLIDLLLRYMVAATKPSPEEAPADDWYAGFADFSLEAEPLVWKFPNNGRIDLLGAGRQGPSYAARVNRFDWNGFYETFGGSAFLNEAMRQAVETYDYVLIDSRTGVSDTSGICTVQLPDSLVVFFTLNTQSIEGASGIAADVIRQRSATSTKRGRQFRVFPVPTRIELAEKRKLEARRKLVAERFGRFLNHMERDERQEYLGSMEVLYDPFYAYEEILATIADQPGTQNSVLAAFEKLTGYLTDGDVEKLARVSEARRDEARTRVAETIVVPASSETEAPVRIDVFIDSSQDDAAREAADALFKRLTPYCRAFFTPRSLTPGMDFKSAISHAIESANVVVAFVSGRNSENNLMNAGLVDEKVRDSGAAVIPVWLDRDAPEHYPSLRNYQGVAMDGADKRASLERVAVAALDILGISARAEPQSVPVSPKPLFELPSTTSGPFDPAWQWIKQNPSIPVILVLVIIGWIYQQFAPGDNKNIEATRLTAASYAQSERDPTLSLLLATAAAETEWSDATATALRSALRTSRELRLYQPAADMGEGVRVVQTEWSPSGELVFSVRADDSANIFRLDDRDTIVFDNGSVVAGTWAPIAGARSGENVRLALKNGRILQWSDLDAMREVAALEVSLMEAAWSPDARSVLVSDGKVVSAWDVQKATRLLSLQDNQSLLPHPWNDGGDQVALLVDGGVFIFDIATAQLTQEIATAERPSTNAWHPSGRYFSAGFESGRCVVWHLSSSRSIACPSHDSPIIWADWESSGEFLATASADGTVLISRFDGSSGFISQTSSGNRVTNSNLPPRAQVSSDFDSLERMGALPEPAYEIAWAPRSFRLLTVSANGIVSIWTVPRGDNARQVDPRSRSNDPVLVSSQKLIAKGAGDALFATWSPDGSWIATSHRNGDVRIWSLDTEALNLEVDAASLLELARERSPRALTPAERCIYSASEKELAECTQN